MKDLIVKILITLGALGILVLHALRPDLQIDAISFGLVVAAILPWLASVIRSAEFPGGWKVEFQDVKQAVDKVTQGSPAPAQPSPVPSYIAIADKDPNLALVGLRIELQKRHRSLAERYEINSGRSLMQIFRELQSRGILNAPSVSGLQELVMAGNRAAHGARVEPAAANWSIEYGP